MKIKYKGSRKIAEHVFSFDFEAPKHYDFIAGQYLEMTLDIINVDERGSSRWFSISSPPNEPVLTITTKIVEKPSSFKKALIGLKNGSLVEISQAMGDFVLPLDDTRSVIFVAGGIGITPFMSILADQLKINETRDISLIYGVNLSSELVNLDKYKHLINHLRLVNSEIDGSVITSNLILKECSNLDNPYIYLAGPEIMVEHIGQELLDQGLEESSLVRDFFPNYQEND